MENDLSHHDNNRTMKLSQLAPVIAALTVTSMPAHAGKQEREFFASNIEPAIKTASASYKQACGCELKFDIKIDTFKTRDDLDQIRNFATTVSDNVGAYCNDAPSKAAMCKMKTLEFTRTSETTFKLSANKGIATTEGQSTPSWEMLTREVDR